MPAIDYTEARAALRFRDMSDQGDNTPAKRPWGKPFQPGNPGRPKGSRNNASAAPLLTSPPKSCQP